MRFRYFSLILFIPFFILSNDIYANNVVQKNVTVQFIAGLEKPPFVMQESNSGLQLELIHAALETQDIDVEFVHMPLGRNIMGLQQLGSDAVATVPFDFQYSGLNVSNTYITYQNVVVTLEKSNIEIKSVNDLSGLSVIAFQNAKKFIGEKYKKQVSYSLDYREFAEQMKQVEMLFSRRTEAIVIDVNIFKYLIKHSEDALLTKPFRIHDIFHKQYYSAGFKSPVLMAKFNEGIKTLKEQGIYQNIMDKYLN